MKGNREDTKATKNTKKTVDSALDVVVVPREE
jgi:hypothetical protein